MIRRFGVFGMFVAITIFVAVAANAAGADTWCENGSDNYTDYRREHQFEDDEEMHAGGFGGIGLGWDGQQGWAFVWTHFVHKDYPEEYHAEPHYNTFALDAGHVGCWE